MSFVRHGFPKTHEHVLESVASTSFDEREREERREVSKDTVWEKGTPWKELRQGNDFKRFEVMEGSSGSVEKGLGRIVREVRDRLKGRGRDISRDSSGGSRALDETSSTLRLERVVSDEKTFVNPQLCTLSSRRFSRPDHVSGVRVTPERSLLGIARDKILGKQERFGIFVRLKEERVRERM